MTVLDASALLAFLYAEKGHEVVAEHLTDAPAVCAVNWSEVLQKIAIQGADAQKVGDWILALGPEIVPFDGADARYAAALYPGTRRHGLSLADRACLALARRLNTVAVTADRAWKNIDAGVRVELIR
jgi:PIN domain nuclease of toxin-antitoxin system